MRFEITEFSRIGRLALAGDQVEAGHAQCPFGKDANFLGGVFASCGKLLARRTQHLANRFGLSAFGIFGQEARLVVGGQRIDKFVQIALDHPVELVKVRLMR